MNNSLIKAISSYSLFFFLFVGFSFQICAQSGRIPLRGEKGMVVTSHYLASQVGNDIFKQGGNAIDATVATAFALAVTLPSAGNIGGGGFIVYHGSDGKKRQFKPRRSTFCWRTGNSCRLI